MKLFDEWERTETRPAKNHEPKFEYVNLSARPAFIAIRRLLEDWFSRYPDSPESGKRDIRNRFRDRNDQNHTGAFFELFLNELFRRLGYTLIPHPDIPGVPTHPDFLVQRDGRSCFYLEATVPESRQVKGSDLKRLNQVHDALQKVQSPDYFLDISHFGYPTTVASVKPLLRKIERWLRELDYQEILRACSDGDLFALPVFTGNVGGMEISVRPLPKSEATRGKEGVDPVGVFGEAAAHVVDTTSAIREAAKAKRKRYGRLNLPYVVAINVLEKFIRMRSVENVVDAVFGREAVRHTSYLDGSEKMEEVRIRDGLWINERGPTNQSISAVLVFLGMWPWNLADIESVLVQNPFADYPLKESLPLKKIVGDRTTGKLDEIAAARSIGDVLGLSTPWPIPDDD